MLDWYTQKIPHLLHELKTDLEHGLSHEEAGAQLSRYGRNKIYPPQETSLLIIFLKQFSNVTAALLLAGAVLLFYSQRPSSALVAGAILIARLLAGFIQEAKSRFQFQAVRKRLEASVSVIRGGGAVQTPPTEVAPGDLLCLTEGDYIAADARIVDAADLVVDESTLFGTAASSIQKTDEDIPSPGLPPEKQKNMVFGGTYVLEGEARAIVVATGKGLEINSPDRRMAMARDLDPESETQVGILRDHFRNVGGILGAIGVVVAFVFGEKLVRGNWVEPLFIGLGFAFASIPDGIVTTARAMLAETAHKLLKQGAAVRNPVDLERLSSLTAVCVEEIGAFTSEEMVASHVFVDERLVDRASWEDWLKALEERTPGETDEDAIPTKLLDSEVPYGFPSLMLLASLCARTNSAENGEMGQSATAAKSVEREIHQIVERIGYDLELYNSAFTKIDDIPRTPERPYRTLVFAVARDKFLQLIFGDAEAVLQSCYRAQTRGTIEFMNRDYRGLISRAIKYLTANRAQVFASAYRNHKTPPPDDMIERKMTFLGLMAFTGVEFPGIREGIQSCLDSGLKIVMLTDKDQNTAADLAKELGLIEDKRAVISREEIEKLNDAMYDPMVEHLLVYSNPTPEQKWNIVRYLKRSGRVVGFWGRSPRDLRAMRAADVGFALASRASHIVRRNAACILFEEGLKELETLLVYARESYTNLRSAMRWLLSCSLAQALTLAAGFTLPYLSVFSPALNELPPTPLSLPQLLWIYLLVGVLPLMSLGRDRMSGELRYTRPQKTQSFLAKLDRNDVLLRSLVLASMGLFSYVVAFLDALDGVEPITLTTRQLAQSKAQTAACTTLIFTLLLSNFQCHRHFGETILHRIGANPLLLLTVLGCIALHLLVIHLPLAQQSLGLHPLHNEWRWILAFSIMVAFVPLNLVQQRR